MIGPSSDLSCCSRVEMFSLAAGERLQDGVSARLPRPCVRPHEGVLALGGRQQAHLQADAPRHGEHVPGKRILTGGN